MAARLIENIRRGQVELQDRKLIDILVNRGIITATDVPGLRQKVEPGTLISDLIEHGQVSQDQISQISEDLEMMDLLETVGEESAPIEVRAAEEDPGRRIGRYVLIDQLGAGGMGVVWKAWDGQLSRWVAIKLLKVQDPKLIRRFTREATLLAKLAHPNITRVYEIGVHEGKPFLVMEMVDGTPPASEGMSRKEAARIIRDAASAVQYAHDEQIIHRDLKPSNLLLSSKGHVFVTDFGLARMREESGSLTASGALLGTPSFMAPEQAQGKEADHRTDVYGLGATLYALVEGQPPYSGELVHEVVKRVAVSNPPSLSGGDDLVIVAQKAMERDREDRYENCRELAEELHRFVDDEPILARKITRVERIWRRAKRKPALASAITAGVLVITSLLVWGGLFVQDYFQKRAQIAAASAPLARGQSAMKALSQMYASQTVHPDWEQQALANLETQADIALKAAPNYAEPKFQKGMVFFWRNDFDTAAEWFTKALSDDANHHEARARRVHARALTMPSAEVIQDHDGFRVTAPRLNSEQSQTVSEIRRDIDQLPEGYGRQEVGSSVIAMTRGDFEQSAANLKGHLDSNSYDKTSRRFYIWALLGNGDYTLAGKNAEILLSVNKGDADAWFLRAFSHAGNNELENAVNAMRQSIHLHDDLSARNWLAFWLGKQQNLDAALDEYTSILKQDPDYMEALLGRSSVLGSVQTPDSLKVGLQDAQRAVKLSPENAYGHFLVGQASLFSNPNTAIAAHEKAIELDPSYHAHSSAAISSAYFALGDLDRAVEYLEAALEQEPEQYNWNWQMVNLYWIQGDSKKAESALAKLPRETPVLLLKSDIRREAGDLSNATKIVLSVVEKESGNALAWAKLARLYADQGEFSQVKKAEDKALAINAFDSAILSTLTYAWYLNSQFDRAKIAAQRYLQAFPQDADANFLLGSILNDQRDAKAALPYLTKALQLGPNDATTIKKFAEVALVTGKAQKAEPVLKSYLDRNPNDLAARLLYGRTHWALGRLPKAANQFDQVIQNNPDLALGWIYRAVVKASMNQCDDAIADIRHVQKQGVEIVPYFLEQIKSNCPEFVSL